MKPRSKHLGLLASLVLLSACTEPREPFSIEFIATYGGEPIHCSSEPVAMTDLRFYVADIEVRRGESVPLLRDDHWQTRELALIDLEDSSGRCINGSKAMNKVLRGTVASGPVSGLAMTIGVPFALNHADPLRAGAPLDDSEMHWHWRSGYKFLRGGIASVDDSYWIHLGSTACEGTVTDISHCSTPNRVRVELPEYRPGDKIAIDFKALLGSDDWLNGTPSDCSSGPAEAACVPAFHSLGLAHSGIEPPGPQRVFKLYR